jgi:hypothetical protein
MMEWLVNFVKSKKWVNAGLAMIAMYGGYLIAEAAKFDFFDKNPNALAFLGLVIGLLTRFYKEQITPDKLNVKDLSDEVLDEAVKELFVRANK